MLWLLMNRNLGIIYNFFYFFMHRLDYRAVKSPVYVKKKYKIAHNFFVTKATDLKALFVRSPWKTNVETYVTLWYLSKKKSYFFTFLIGIFSTLSSSQTLKVIGLIFSISWPWKMIMHFNPIPNLYVLFLGYGTPPGFTWDSDPPLVFKGLRIFMLIHDWENIFFFSRRKTTISPSLLFQSWSWSV